jgi:hypothetical protein
MASRIQYIPASITYEAPAGTVIEKVLVTATTSGTAATVTLFGRSLFDHNGTIPVADADGVSVTFPSGSLVPIEGPFTKITSGASTTCLIYLK